MKKSIILLLIATLCLTLVACAPKVIADGQYTVEVMLTGGSGRASVESPTALTAKSGAIIATVVWSSPFYEWMQVDGVQYEPVQESGNATFIIPVELDTDIPVRAQTVAMSQPHVIEYTLRFDSASIQTATLE